MQRPRGWKVALGKERGGEANLCPPLPPTRPNGGGPRAWTARSQDRGPHSAQGVHPTPSPALQPASRSRPDGKVACVGLERGGQTRPPAGSGPRGITWGHSAPQVMRSPGRGEGCFLNELRRAEGPGGFLGIGGGRGPGGFLEEETEGAPKDWEDSCATRRLRNLGGAREAERAAPRNSGCGQAAGARNAEPAATAEQPSSRPASACLCVLRGSAAGRRPNPCSRAASARPAGRKVQSTAARGPRPRRRRRRRRRRSRQREWAGGLGTVTGQGRGGGRGGREGGARRPWQAAGRGRPRAPQPRPDRGGSRPPALPAHTFGAGQGVPRRLLPEALSPPAALEFRLRRSKTRAACLNDGGVGGQGRSRLLVGVGVCFRATGQYGPVSPRALPACPARAEDTGL